MGQLVAGWAGAGPGLDSRLQAHSVAPLARKAWSGINHNMPRERERDANKTRILLHFHNPCHPKAHVTSDKPLLVLVFEPPTRNR